MKGGKFFGSYVPRKGFKTASALMFVTLILVVLGLIWGKILLLIISLITGAVGVYFVKKSWVSYKPKKEVKKKKN